MTDPTPDPTPEFPPPLATPDDLALVSLGSISDNDAKELLKDASAEARAFCGDWLISEADYSVDLDSVGDPIILLPAMHVTAVSLVQIGDRVLVDGTDYEWSTSGVLEGRFPRGRRNVHVEFTAGFDPVPRDVVAAVCALAARTAATRGGFTSQRIGSLALGGFGAGSLALTDPEAVLARYRLT